MITDKLVDRPNAQCNTKQSRNKQKKDHGLVLDEFRQGVVDRRLPSMVTGDTSDIGGGGGGNGIN